MKEPKSYYSLSAYKDSADYLHAVCGMVLFCFANQECDLKNIIIRNFIARSAMTIKSIFALWDNADYHNAWIVNRSLVDRMFHLRHLIDTDSFSDFDDWSFFQQFKHQNRVRSDPEFKCEAVGSAYKLSDDQKVRLKKLTTKKPVWARPKAEDVAKKMGMEFLYKYSYDYASMHVHPMANDGQQDFYSITKLEPLPDFPDQISVISNTILTATMILQESISGSSFVWNKILFDYIDNIRLFLSSGDVAYQSAYIDLSRLFLEGRLCKKQEFN